MKFYYNGELVRTSKTHHYTHAVIDSNNGRLIGCCSRLDLAKKLRDSEISEIVSGIENCKRAIKALEAGKRVYRCKVGNREYMEKTYFSLDQWKAFLKSDEQKLEYKNKYFKVVELEERD